MMSNQSAAQPVPGYQIVGKLGAGGMAVVFKAKDIKNDRLVALKILLPKTVQDKVLLARFVREAKLLIKFQHPNIVKGYQAGMANGLYFLAMEYVEGKSAAQMLEAQGVLPEDLATNIILQAAQVLDYTQKQGILHRDIKPDNLLITADNLVKLCDLGLAQPIGCKVPETSTDITCGTPQYMSPEQAQGQLDLDIRSDIYSLGATFFHLVTGKAPFSGTDNMEVMAKQVLAELQSEEIKNRRLSPLTLYFIEKMMAKEKEVRYQSPAEVFNDIQTEVAGYKSLEYEPEEPSPEPEPPAKKSRIAQLMDQNRKKKPEKK